MAAPSSPRSSARGEAGSTFVASVESLAWGGPGLVRLEDGTVHLVEGVAPGDEIEVALEKPQKGEAKRARLVRVIEPGPDRVAPVCPLAARCGGCDWMHLGVDAQEREHARLVRDQLAHATGEPAPEPIVHRAPRPLAYRTRARLHVSTDGRRVALGYHRGRSRDIVEPETCAVLEPGLLEAARKLADALLGLRGSGEIAIGWGSKEGARAPVVDLVLEGEPPATFWRALDDAVHADLGGARVTLAGSSKPATFGDPRPVQVGFDGAPLVLPAGGFAQPSDEGAAILARRVKELANARDLDVHELFAGAGTLTVALAGDARVSSIEIDEAAIACARENLARRGLTAKQSIGDAESSPIPKRASVVVLDPPRTGARGACKAIAEAKPKRVVYVSCDPPTLARDARLLADAGYALIGLEIVELFPQTSHVETIAVFSRGKRKAGA